MKRELATISNLDFNKKNEQEKAHKILSYEIIRMNG